MLSQSNKKTVFIVNPSAGRGKCEKRWGELERKINGRYPYDVIFTNRRGEAETKAKVESA